MTSRILAVLNLSARRPIETIEVLIATVLFLFGIYLLTPSYMEGGPNSFGIAFRDNEVAKTFVAITLYIVSSLPILLGLFFKRLRTCRWRAWATMGMFIGAMFVTLLRILIIGFNPPLWLFTLALGLIIGVCHVYNKVVCGEQHA